MLVSSQSHIFAGEKFNKGKLLLLPMGTLQVVAASKASSSQCIIRSSNLKDNVYVVIPWKCDFGKKSGLFCPFWMVKEEPTAEDPACKSEPFKWAVWWFLPTPTRSRLSEALLCLWGLPKKPLPKRGRDLQSLECNGQHLGALNTGGKRHSKLN